MLIRMQMHFSENISDDVSNDVSVPSDTLPETSLPVEESFEKNVTEDITATSTEIFEPINILNIVNEAVKELSSFARKAGILINISADSDNIIIKADYDKIKIMFRNIIDNSIKYMNRRGSLVITVSNIGSDIFIVLKDTGDGLNSTETEHIFELNYQGSNRISGNGLGLTQAKKIVNSYGGTIYAKSNLGRGMGIYIQLPTN